MSALAPAAADQGDGRGLSTALGETGLGHRQLLATGLGDCFCQPSQAPASAYHLARRDRHAASDASFGIPPWTSGLSCHRRQHPRAPAIACRLGNWTRHIDSGLASDTASGSSLALPIRVPARPILLGAPASTLPSVAPISECQLESGDSSVVTRWTVD